MTNKNRIKPDVIAIEFSARTNSSQKFPNFVLVDDKKEKWAIIHNNERLTRKGEWIHEPMPSSRTDKFLKQTQFGFQEGMAMYREVISKIANHDK